ncbi:LacI family DNA-binding transcriptional regulator [Bifidobacterium biavatii]|uniref:LacI family sucrose operon transcriptional repressor n=1 Tax=Bifidobacterium biavatii DSM 23969 TaxID=1437608 RepID=A0A086ZNI9_9BIFI|nr:LacI family DNA-binding transcriptional regulator [Bifidobacterium biavatii]KFI48089.1 LacI family sucrose operon transcriptional repressor [Bifidobacterium biavatii DSM 23969]
MVGMRDVAKQAGVSLSTVSLVVNDAGYVSEGKRERVVEAMRLLNYVPNELARNLYRDRTNTIGVIVPTIRHPFFATFTSVLQREFSARGLRTMLCSTEDSDKGESEYVDMLRRHMMDGIVMSSHTMHPVDYWTSISRPIVAFDRYLGPGIPLVGSDHESGGHMVADLLIRSGARHVAMIGGLRSQFHDLAMRGAPGTGERDTTFPTACYYLTLEQDLRAAGVRYDYVEAGGVGDFEGYAIAVHNALEWFGNDHAVDAGCFDDDDAVDAIVSSDIGASYAVQAALRCGLRVPDDVQIIAYDGTYLTGTAGVRLTAVRQDFNAIATAVVARMIALIEGEDAPSESSAEDAAPQPVDLIPVSLHLGDSTR